MKIIDCAVSTDFDVIKKINRFNEPERNEMLVKNQKKKEIPVNRITINKLNCRIDLHKNCKQRIFKLNAFL